jgi:phospholipase C
VWGEPLEICAGPFETEVPLVDPDHNFAGVTYEIFRKWNITKDDVPNMGGFVERQSEKYESTPGDAAFVIKAYDQKKTALLAELAENFAFFDAYVSLILTERRKGECGS